MPAQIYRTLYTEPDLTGLDTPWLREITLACLDKQAERRPTAQPLLDFLLVSAPPSPAGPWLPPAVMAALAQRVQQSEHLLEIHRLATEKAAAERRRRSRRAVIKGAAGVAVLAAVGTGSVVLIVENSIPPRSPEWSGLRVTTTPLSPPNPGGWNYTKEAQLAGPHGSVGISWSAVGDELDSHEAADLHTSAIRARPGQKLLVAAVDQMVTYAAFPPGKANPVVVKLKVGDQSTDLKNLPLSENSSTTQVIVVGAAPTTPIRLQLVDAGRMAEMDLRTAKVIDNPYQQFQSDAAWTGSATATAFFYGQPVTTENLRFRRTVDQQTSRIDRQLLSWQRLGASGKGFPRRASTRPLRQLSLSDRSSVRRLHRVFLPSAQWGGGARRPACPYDHPVGHFGDHTCAGHLPGARRHSRRAHRARPEQIAAEGHQFLGGHDPPLAEGTHFRTAAQVPRARVRP
nr:hypothetical protein [Fodinicola feengrottensis]